MLCIPSTPSSNPPWCNATEWCASWDKLDSLNCYACPHIASADKFGGNHRLDNDINIAKMHLVKESFLQSLFFLNFKFTTCIFTLNLGDPAWMAYLKFYPLTMDRWPITHLFRACWMIKFILELKRCFTSVLLCLELRTCESYYLHYPNSFQY